MSDMIICTSGRLESTPKMMLGHNNSIMTKCYLLTYDEEGHAQEARIPVIAEGTVAEQILRYKAGDLLHCLCVTADVIMTVDGAAMNTLGFKAILVDDDHKILPEVNEKILNLIKEIQQ